MAKPVARNITISINGKEVENSLSGVGKEIGKLKGQLRKETFGSENFTKLNTQLKATQKEYARMSNEVRGTSKAFKQQSTSVLGNIKSFAALAFGITAVIEVLRQAITFAIDFTKESIKLAKEAKGVEFAFRRLGDEGADAFSRIKASTRGLLSDLDIKKSLVEFDNFNISLKEADVLMEFLAVRSAQTGQSVDKLKDSLVEGLSKESKLRIDNLGISAGELNDELAKTPDFVQAVGNIAKREIAEAGNILDEASNSSERFNASVENLKLALGNLFTSQGGGAGIFAGIIERITSGVKLLQVGITSLRIGFNEFITPIKELANQFPLLNKGFEVFQSLFKFNGLQVFALAISELGAALGGLSNVFKVARREIKEFISSLSVFGEIELDFLNPVKTFKSLKDFDFKGALAGIKDNFRESGDELANAFGEGYDNVKQKVREANEAAAREGAPELGETGETPEQIKAREAAEQLAQKTAEEIRRNEQSLTEFIKAEREARNLNALEGLAKEEERIRQKYANEIELAQNNAALLKQIEQLRDEELEEARVTAKQAYLERLNAIDEANEDLKDEAAFEREVAAAETQLEKDELRLERARELALEELKILEEAELAKVNAVDGAEELKAKIRENFALQGNKLNREFDKQERDLKKDQVTWTELTEQQKLDAIAGALATAAEAFNEGSAAWKATKIAETLISTYQGAQNAFNALAPIPIVGPALGTAAAGLAVVAGLKKVQTISNTKLEKIKKPKGYYDGGYTGSQSYGRDHQGEVAGVVHTNEWVAPAVMTSDPKYANIIGWLENERIGRTKGYFNGGPVTAPSGDSGITLPTSAPSNDDLSRAILTLNTLLSNGINAKLNIGYPEAEAIDSLQNEINQRAASSNLA